MVRSPMQNRMCLFHVSEHIIYARHDNIGGKPHREIRASGVPTSLGRSVGLSEYSAKKRDETTQ
jgi:hypothetical protein